MWMCVCFDGPRCSGVQSTEHFKADFAMLQTVILLMFERPQVEDSNEPVGLGQEWVDTMEDRVVVIGKQYRAQTCDGIQ